MDENEARVTKLAACKSVDNFCLIWFINQGALYSHALSVIVVIVSIVIVCV